jgi:4-amino-4-deoxy-L-arabinose transferase-like glycosyltransferase
MGASTESSKVGRNTGQSGAGGGWRLHFGIIVAAAAAVRAVYLVQISQWPFFYYPVLDSRTQYHWGEILARTYGVGSSDVLGKAPLYAYFLAFNVWFGGGDQASLYSARALQLLLGALTCGIVYLIGRRVFGVRAGLAAGLVAVLYSPALFREGQLLDTGLATFLAASFLLALVGALDKPSVWRWLGCGLLLALLGLTRPNMLLLAPVGLGLLLAWLRKGREPEQVRAMAVAFVVGVGLPVLMITVRNWYLSDAFVPIATNGGVNFHTGNNPQSDGYSPVPSGIAWERTWYEALAADKVEPQEQDGYWLRQGLLFWRRQPGRAMGLLVKKACLYWGAYEIPNNVSYGWGRAHSSALRVVPLTFAVVGPLGLLGLVLGGWRSRQAWVVTLFVLTQMVGVIAFFVAGRYRMPALPALYALSGFAVVELARLAGARRWGGLAAALGALVVFGLLVNGDLYGVGRARGANRDWYYLAQSYMAAEDRERTREALRRAVEQNPRDADAYALLGMVEASAGEAEKAAGQLRKALEVAPDFTRAALQLSELHLVRGWPLEEPEELLTRALAAQRLEVVGLARLVQLNVRLGHLQAATTNLARGAAALGYYPAQDARTMAEREMLMGAAAEARAAGALVPPELEQQPASGQSVPEGALGGWPG